MALEEHQEEGKEWARNSKGNIVGKKKKLKIVRFSTSKVKKSVKLTL
jgi:hypothetical protein